MREQLKEHLRRKLNQNILNEVSLYQDGYEPPGYQTPAQEPGEIEPEISPIPSYNPFSPQYYNQDVRQILQWYYQNDPLTAPRVIWNLQHGYPWWYGIAPSAWPPRR